MRTAETYERLSFWTAATYRFADPVPCTSSRNACEDSRTFCGDGLMGGMLSTTWTKLPARLLGTVGVFRRPLEEDPYSNVDDAAQRRDVALFGRIERVRLG